MKRKELRKCKDLATLHHRTYSLRSNMNHFEFFLDELLRETFSFDFPVNEPNIKVDKFRELRFPLNVKLHRK